MATCVWKCGAEQAVLGQSVVLGLMVKDPQGCRQLDLALGWNASEQLFYKRQQITKCVFYMSPNVKLKQPNQVKQGLWVFHLHWIWPINEYWVMETRDTDHPAKWCAWQDASHKLLSAGVQVFPWLIWNWEKLWKNKWLLFTAPELACLEQAFKEQPQCCRWPCWRQRAWIWCCHHWASHLWEKTVWKTSQVLRLFS